MRIIVIDGQGGGLGSALVTRLKARLGDKAQVWALGINALATSAMLKAGADKAATGENAICYNAAHADLILGPIGLLSANALMGEVSPAIAAAVSAAPCRRILVPAFNCGVLVAGTAGLKMEDLLQSAVDMVVKEVEA
jgi:NAD(P)-dependent dehydrogenase (short-subunit alcohol dehydrogenase family)